MYFSYKSLAGPTVRWPRWVGVGTVDGVAKLFLARGGVLAQDGGGNSAIAAHCSSLRSPLRSACAGVCSGAAADAAVADPGAGGPPRAAGRPARGGGAGGPAEPRTAAAGPRGGASEAAGTVLHVLDWRRLCVQICVESERVVVRRTRRRSRRTSRRCGPSRRGASSSGRRMPPPRGARHGGGSAPRKWICSPPRSSRRCALHSGTSSRSKRCW